MPVPYRPHVDLQRKDCAKLLLQSLQYDRLETLEDVPVSQHADLDDPVDRDILDDNRRRVVTEFQDNLEVIRWAVLENQLVYLRHLDHELDILWHLRLWLASRSLLSDLNLRVQDLCLSASAGSLSRFDNFFRLIEDLGCRLALPFVLAYCGRCSH